MNNQQLQNLSDTECVEATGGGSQGPELIVIITELAGEIGQAIAGFLNGLGGIDGCKQ